MCQFYVEHINYLFHLNANNPANAQVLLQNSAFTKEEEKTLSLLAEKIEIKDDKRKKIDTEKDVKAGTHTHAQTHTKTHAKTHVKTHAKTHTKAHAQTHVQTHAQTHAQTHDQTHAQTHAHAHAHTEAHAHTQSKSHSKDKSKMKNKIKSRTKNKIKNRSPLKVSPSVGQLPSDRRDQLAKILATPPDFTPDPSLQALPSWLQPSPVFQQLLPNVYQQFAQLCAVHVPFSIMDTCTKLLPQFQAIANALRFGDRPDEICRSVAPSCPPGSYIDEVPHDT